jgi:integrase
LNQFDFQPFQKKTDFITLLQLLTFVRSLDFKQKTLTSKYRQFKFPLRDFLNYTNDGRSIHHYQVIQLKEFLNALRKNIIIESFTDEYYRMLVTIPDVKVHKSKTHRNRWVTGNGYQKRDPMTGEIYKELIKAAEGPTYINLRTRMALCILAVTGIRINELLPLKVSQLETLFKENWIAIDRSKRGPSNHKAFLTKEGKKIIQDRQKDFQLIFLMKEPDSYLFTAEANHNKPLDRVAITRDVNKVMREVSNQLPGKPNITSHSFRIGYITQLWKDSKDIEFVKQTIGHRKLDTTSAYVNKLSDQERHNKV